MKNIAIFESVPYLEENVCHHWGSEGGGGVVHHTQKLRQSIGNLRKKRRKRVKNSPNSSHQFFLHRMTIGNEFSNKFSKFLISETVRSRLEPQTTIFNLLCEDVSWNRPPNIYYKFSYCFKNCYPKSGAPQNPQKYNFYQNFWIFSFIKYNFSNF